MKQRFPRRTRPLVAAAAILFASFGFAAASHVVRTGPDLYARLAVIQVLRAPDEKVREDALAFLKKVGPRGLNAVASRSREGPIPDELFAIVAQFGGDEEIDVLTGSIAGSGDERRKLAVGALARIHSEAAARAAGPALADPSPEIRELAHEALRGHPAEILGEAVRQALGVPSFQPEFVSAVLVNEGLVAAAVGPVSEGLRSDEPIRIYNSLNLARATFPRFPPGAGKEATLVASIAAAIPRFEPQAQALAIEILVALSGPEALDAICDAARSSRLGMTARSQAIEALGVRPGPKATAALEEVIRGARIELRFAAAEALAKTAKEADAARWLDRIESEAVDHEGREALLRGISVRGSISLVPRLFALARKSDSRTIEETLHRLFTRDPRGAIPYLLDEMKEAEPQLLNWLDMELRNVTGHQTRIAGAWRTAEDYQNERDSLKKDWSLWWSLNKDRSLEEWKTSAQHETEGGLHSSKPAERAEAVMRLIKLAPSDLDLRLAAMLDDPSEFVWVRVQTGLTGPPSPSGNDALRARLGDNSPRAASRAARVLGLRGDRVSVDALILAAKAGDVTVRREAAAALGRIGDPKASRTLVPLLRDPDSALQDAARDALDALADRSIEGDLLEGLRSTDAGFRLSCITLLGRCGTRLAVRPLLKHFHDPDENAQQSALRSFQALAGITPPVLDPSESEIRNWENLVERRQR
ncbi:MAG: HEAT repeat domain-containing protein [Planctomycetes bacterium]|nr:HEAT repeat domain-containing protein [Planctomycetota bacterium]